MDHNEMISRIGDEMKNSGTDFNLDDPFDDPSLCTTAFMDIMWQDEHGNSALMLAAAENRVQQVKGILHMAINSGKMWQVIDMRNKENLNCVDMAIRAGSETCAILITKVAREYAKHRPRSEYEKKFDTLPTTEEDVSFTLEGARAVEHFDDNYIKKLVRQSSSASGHSVAAKKLSREKISNNLTAASQGKDYLRMVKRSSSAHSRLMSQRTCSVESGSVDSSEPSTPQMTAPPADHGVLSSVGERIRSIFGKKPPLHTKSLSLVQADRASSPAARSSSVSGKPYHVTGVASEEDHLKLPQHSTDSPPDLAPVAQSSGLFRWGSKDRGLQTTTTTTANGVRLPPLSLTRRRASDQKQRDFSSLGGDE
uniref:ANK_REP_REGION domain-containing protein n=1 Tax=Caenorhabditis tropicalis TaxID=1561998 RepID=A0A1I7UR16_9PELO